MVNALNIKISNLTREIQNLERGVMLLDSKWRVEISSSSIEEKAREILGMRYPERREIFKIENFNIMDGKNGR